MSPSLARRWIFVSQFPEDGSVSQSRFVDISFGDSVRFSIWQLEAAPSTGKLHLQGYVEFIKPCRASGVSKQLGLAVPSPHLEVAKGTQEQNIKYCSKSDTRVAGPWEFGTRAVNGRRKDLDEVANLIQSGSTLSEVCAVHPVPYIMYRRGIEALCTRMAYEESQVFRELRVSVYYGTAGTGKTRRAVEESTDGGYFILDQGDRVWFDGYESQDTLIIDDFYGWIKYGMLLRILDGYQYRAEVKGGFIYARWTKVIITSNDHPDRWYQKFLDHGGVMSPALARRINVIEEMN